MQDDNMKELSADSFFSLEEFTHAPLFKRNAYVWEALKSLVTYLQSQKLGQIATDVPDTAYLVNATQISIGPGTRIEPGAYIEGPCIIGAHCTVRHGAYIRGNVITGDHCVIGHATEIKQSILLNHVSAAHFNYVGDSILGNGVNLGAGVICANLRLDHQPIRIKFSDQKIATEMKKLGAIVGDRAQIGCQCVLNPGTFIAKDTLCQPHLTISGNDRAAHLRKSNSQQGIKQ